MRRPRLSQLPPLPLLIALLCLAAAGPAAADPLQTSWEDTLVGAPTWHRPTRNLQQVATGAATPYSVKSLYVVRSGSFEFDSNLPSPNSGIPLNGFVFLYAGAFDPSQPLRNLVAGSEGGPDGTSLARVAATLTAGAIYNVVTTSDDPTAGRFHNDVYGLGEVRDSGCPAQGQTPPDPNSLGLTGDRFCVSVTWKDPAGVSHTAFPIQFRSDESASFWFSDPGNWELQVKVLDACAFNHRFWVLLSGTTNLDYQVNVFDSQQQSTVSRRSYHSPQGSTGAILDTNAFDGCL